MSIYDTLNEQQKLGVKTTEGPVLILAGAGSGKTRVLTHRIAYLIEEKGVSPYNIMAITFTNKAAGEMRERVDRLIGHGAESVWVATFHATCVRILRRYIDRIGYDNHFTIYDTDDQKSLMRTICKDMQIDTKNVKERTLLNAISAAKNELVTPDEMEQMAGGNYNLRRQASVYREYQKRLKSNNALDFDDLLMLTVELFRRDSEVLNSYQERFRYIMVDEYQDTNTAQFELISLLAKKYRNLCVVGDDDQSIYGFRGANIQNILSFEQTFDQTTVIKLEQNYRSTQNILNAANEVIHNNTERKEKSLWSDKGDGSKVNYRIYDNAIEEAVGIVNDIKKRVEDGKSYKDFAVLYRTNAQARVLEERFVTGNVPYRVYGGVNFYQRKEIKDILAYLKTVNNGRDDLAVLRIINVPKRGIGAASIEKVREFANANIMSFFEALEMADEIPSLNRASAKILSFVDYIDVLKSKAQIMGIAEFIEEVIHTSGYDNVIEENSDTDDEAQDRKNNLIELISKAAAYEESTQEATLSGFLEEVALVADIDNLDPEAERVSLMTLHAAKGLEFPVVYLAGMEEGLFPSYMSITSDNALDVEEERRLCYVGITRAREVLNLSYARSRMVNGEMRYNTPSRFIKEISPLQLVQQETERYEKKHDEMREKLPWDDSAVSARKTARTQFKETRMTAKAAYTVNENPVAGKLDYQVGDTVRHIKFGKGVVKNIASGGRDYEVTVEFEDFGVKKMFASFAKLVKA
jgi:DNA helicase-2/ATP-dependent DNA helicase PcrA